MGISKQFRADSWVFNLLILFVYQVTIMEVGDSIVAMHVYYPFDVDIQYFDVVKDEWKNCSFNDISQDCFGHICGIVEDTGPVLASFDGKCYAGDFISGEAFITGIIAVSVATLINFVVALLYFGSRCVIRLRKNVPLITGIDLSLNVGLFLFLVIFKSIELAMLKVSGVFPMEIMQTIILSLGLIGHFVLDVYLLVFVEPPDRHANIEASVQQQQQEETRPFSSDIVGVYTQ